MAEDKTVGEQFIADKVWRQPITGRHFILLGTDISTTDAGFEKTVTAFPTVDGKLHYGIMVRDRFLNVLANKATDDQMAYHLNQILPWDVIARVAPKAYAAWKEKMDYKAEQTAICERNRLARLERKELAARLANKSASQFAREERALQLEK